MTKMGKVFLTVLVLMLTCFLVIGAGSSEVRAEEKKPGKKLIKIWVDETTGQIASVTAVGADGKDLEPTPLMPPLPNFQHVATLGFFKKNPTCYIFVIGGYGYEVCW